MKAAQEGGTVLICKRSPLGGPSLSSVIEVDFNCRLQSLCDNSKFEQFCRARHQAGTLKSSRCPPEGGRYNNQNRVLTLTLQPLQLQGLKPLIGRRFSPGLKSRPPKDRRHGNAFQIRTLPRGAEKMPGQPTFRGTVAGLPIRTGTWIVFPRAARSEYFVFGLPNPSRAVR